MSKLFRNVPIVSELEMSPFWCRAEHGSGTVRARVRGRGGKGAAIERPFPPAHRLIKFDCTHLLVLRFPEKNFAPGWPQRGELQLGRAIASPSLALVSLVAARIHSEASRLATMRSGISAFFDQVGFR